MTDSALASAAAEVEEDFFRFQTLETLFGLLEEEHLPEWLPAFPNIIGCLLVAGDTRDAIEPQSVGRFRHANIIAVCYTRSDTSTVQYSTVGRFHNPTTTHKNGKQKWDKQVTTFYRQ